MAEEKKSSGIDQAVTIIAELTKAVPVYQDAIQPAAREIGQGLETVAKAVIGSSLRVHTLRDRRSKHSVTRGTTMPCENSTPISWRRPSTRRPH